MMGPVHRNEGWCEGMRAMRALRELRERIRGVSKKKRMEDEKKRLLDPENRILRAFILEEMRFFLRPHPQVRWG